ncbi:MAG: Gfo/Idh/MocA family oxidoreductase [Patescibacteria group bacterium]
MNLKGRRRVTGRKNLGTGEAVAVLMVGFGPHAQRIHFPAIQKNGAEFNAYVAAIVELQSKEEDVRSYIAGLSLAVEPELLFLPDSQAGSELSQAFRSKLDLYVQTLGISAVIIATEPLAHIPYARWALKKGLHVLMDKPISTKKNASCDIAAAREIAKDYDDLLALLKRSRLQNPSLVFDLVAQRRFHPAFLLLQSLVTEVAERTGMPISSVSSVHSDGQWRMPDEIIDIDYHSYNQGYGKCSHSGYHSLDILSWLIETTTPDSKRPDAIDVFSNFMRPQSFYKQLTRNDYQKIFPDYSSVSVRSDRKLQTKFTGMGEIDALLSLTFKKKGVPMTLASISLLHNGTSQRGWVNSKDRDLYKGNGRIRHESHYIVQGPFQAISFVSYQSKEYGQSRNDIYGMGGEHHLDVHVFRNDSLFPDWEARRTYTFKDISAVESGGASQGHQEDARRLCIKNFFEQVHTGNLNSNSSLEDHRTSAHLLSAVYESACKRLGTENPLVTLQTV